MEMRDRERGTVFWSFGYPENIDQTHQIQGLVCGKNAIHTVETGYYVHIQTFRAKFLFSVVLLFFLP